MSSFDLGKRVRIEGDDGSKRLRLHVDGQQVASITRKSLQAALWDVVGSVYLPMPCPFCGRNRLEFNGREIRCEKCLWVPDREIRATIIVDLDGSWGVRREGQADG